MTKTIDGKKIKLQIWDTNGHERFNPVHVTSSYYKGCVVVYDITNERSFNNIKEWIEAIRRNANADVQILLLGNNCHLEDKRQITKERGEQLAREHGTNFLEASADISKGHQKQIESKQETMKETKMTEREVYCKSAQAYLSSEDPSDRRFRYW